MNADYGFHNWTADDGLPQNIIRGIYQGNDGYLWLATLNGLVRFDGVRFTVFNKTNSPGIRSGRFSSLYGSPNGDLWLSTDGAGITQYHDGVFRTFTTKQGLPNNFVREVIGDPSGNLWGLSGDRIVQWDATFQRFSDVTPTNLRIHYDSILWNGGGFWGSDENGLHCFVDGRFTTYSLPRALNGVPIWGVAREKGGALWLETFAGKQFTIGGPHAPAQPVTSASRVMLDRELDERGSLEVHVGNRLVRYVNDTAGGSVAKVSFSTLFRDREGDIWLGTEGQGLFRLTRKFITTYSQQQGLPGSNVYVILKDRLGTIWVATWHAGVSRFQEGTFRSYSISGNLRASGITALFDDRIGRLWIGAQDKVRLFASGRLTTPIGPALPEHSTVQAIYQDPEGTFWFGTSLGLLRYRDGYSQLLTSKSELATDDVRVLVQGSHNVLWIGGYGGLTRFADGRFTRWTERDGLPADTIRSIYEDGDGVVWIGTYDGGLIRFAAGKFTHYDTRVGMFDNGAFQILEDDRDNLWMSCNRGIYRVSKKELNEFSAGSRAFVTSIAYGKADGMLNAECNGGYWPAGARADDGKLWFPTQDGVAVIDPDGVPTNRQPPPVVIESFLIDRRPAALDRPLRIAPERENFEIQYTALSFINSDQIRFKYKLEGLDSGWVDAGVRRTAYYSHVPPGTYSFIVIAGNSDGIWNETGKSIAITILAPIYFRWWFESLGLLCATCLVWAAWRYRVRQLERAQAVQTAFSRQLIASQENERKRIAGELHDSLGQRLVVVKNLALFFLRSQGKPTVNADGLEIIEELSAEATAAIEETRQISYNLRPFQLDRLGLTKAIEGIVRSVVTASGMQVHAQFDNIDDVFPEELRINFYRIVQESLNNVMKHSQATEVHVKIERTRERVVLTLEDNGRGFSPSDRTAQPGSGGFGLTGMAERAQLLGGEFRTRSAPGSGAILNVEIPINGGDRA